MQYTLKVGTAQGQGAATQPPSCSARVGASLKATLATSLLRLVQRLPAPSHPFLVPWWSFVTLFQTSTPKCSVGSASPFHQDSCMGTLINWTEGVISHLNTSHKAWESMSFLVPCLQKDL